MHWAPLASKEGGPGGGLCVKHKVNSTTIQQLLLAPALFYWTLYNLTVLPIFLHSLGHCKCICLSTFGLSSFKEFARVIPPQNPSSKDPQKIPKRPSGDPSPGNPSTFFSHAHTVGSIGAKKGGERQFWLVDRKRLALSKYSIALSQMWESFPCCGICAGFP